MPKKSTWFGPSVWPGLDLHHLRQGEAHRIRPVGGPWPPGRGHQEVGGLMWFSPGKMRLFTGKDMAFTSKKAWERCGMLYMKTYMKTWV